MTMPAPETIPDWALSSRPWDEARKLEVIRHDYRPAGEVIDPGVNFFVLTLEAIGARPIASCEGHPDGFYVFFEASYELAQSIEAPGYFTVELESRTHGPDHWSIRLPEDFEQTERGKRQTLRWAAKAWQEAFWSFTTTGDRSGETVNRSPKSLSGKEIGRGRLIPTT